MENGLYGYGPYAAPGRLQYDGIFGCCEWRFIRRWCGSEPWIGCLPQSYCEFRIVACRTSGFLFILQALYIVSIYTWPAMYNKSPLSPPPSCHPPSLTAPMNATERKRDRRSTIFFLFLVDFFVVLFFAERCPVRHSSRLDGWVVKGIVLDIYPSIHTINWNLCACFRFFSLFFCLLLIVRIKN